MYNVWKEYGSDEYGWNADVVAAFNSENDALAYVAENGGTIIYSADCVGYPEFW